MEMQLLQCTLNLKILPSLVDNPIVGSLVVDGCPGENLGVNSSLANQVLWPIKCVSYTVVLQTIIAASKLLLV